MRPQSYVIYTATLQMSRWRWLAGIGLVAIGVALLARAVSWLHDTGRFQFNHPDPSVFPVVGIDVSHHQGPIDWRQVAVAGIDFAYIKATEGKDLSDPMFPFHWRAADAAGIPHGAYHFFTFCSPGKDQAEHFLREAPPEPGALPPAADVEFFGNCRSYGDLASVRAELEVFMEIVAAAWGRSPVLYVTPEALESVVGKGMSEHPIWIRSVFTQPALDDYREWMLWQFSDNSRVPGIQGFVDRNALRPGSTLLSLDRVPGAIAGSGG
jgi:lysozyme